MNTYFLIEVQMNLLRHKLITPSSSYNVKNYIKIHTNYNRNFHSYRKRYVVCYKNNKIDMNNNVCDDNKMLVEPTSYSGDRKNIDNGLFMFTILVFSSVMVLSTCVVMILCARETSMEASSLQEKYNKLYSEVKHLEEKNAQDEFVINAIVGEIIELKSIGII